MANINRGEQDLTLDGTTYTLVLLNADLANLENTLDIGAEELFTRMREQKARVSHVDAVIARAFQHVKPKLSRKDIEAMIPAIPYSERRLAASMLLAGALNYLNEQQTTTEEPDEGEPVKSPLSATDASNGER